jgi:hypothetical protein
MEQNMRFGLILGQLAICTEKKIGADYQQFLRQFFFMFSWAKKKVKFILNIVVSARKCC